MFYYLGVFCVTRKPYSDDFNMYNGLLYFNKIDFLGSLINLSQKPFCIFCEPCKAVVSYIDSRTIQPYIEYTRWLYWFLVN